MSKVSSHVHRIGTTLSRRRQLVLVSSNTNARCASMHPIEPAASFSFAATACNKIPRGEIQLTVSTLSQVRHASASAGPTSSTEVNEEPSQAGRATDAVIQRAKGLAEPYVAERATETLFKECARQADYIVPQAFEKKVAIPTNEAGEHIGEGTGWWYESESSKTKTNLI